MHDYDLPVIYPEWNAPSNVGAFTTTTFGGVSASHFASMNLGHHVGDDSENVAKNRDRLQRFMGKTKTLCWLSQTHSDIVIEANNYTQGVEADAITTNSKNYACVVMTADCLPIVLASKSGARVATLHCGWKGLQHNLIGKVISKHFSNDAVIAWLGPAIAPTSYEVDDTLYSAFIDENNDYKKAFVPTRPKHYQMNLYSIATHQLMAANVLKTDISGGQFDTYSDPRFFSYRRNSTTGRIATVAYIKA